MLSLPNGFTHPISVIVATRHDDLLPPRMRCCRLFPIMSCSAWPMANRVEAKGERRANAEEPCVGFDRWWGLRVTNVAINEEMTIGRLVFINNPNHLHTNDALASNADVVCFRSLLIVPPRVSVIRSVDLKAGQIWKMPTNRASSHDEMPLATRDPLKVRTRRRPGMFSEPMLKATRHQQARRPTKPTT